MTKDEFNTELKQIIKNCSEEIKPAIKRILDQKHDLMCWTHCHSCGRSNHRYFDTYKEDYDELLVECSGDTCCHCGSGGMKLYCGYTNGEQCELPSRSDIVFRVGDVIDLHEFLPSAAQGE